MRSRTTPTALATATLVGAPAVAQASPPIRFADVTTGGPRSLPTPEVGPSMPVIDGVLVLRRIVPARTRSADRAHGGVRVLSIHVGDNHRGFLFRVRR